MSFLYNAKRGNILKKLSKTEMKFSVIRCRQAAWMVTVRHSMHHLPFGRAFYTIF